RDDINVVQIAPGESRKEIHCEEPCNIDRDESIELAKAVKRNKRIFNASTQGRSIENFRLACHEAAVRCQLGRRAIRFNPKTEAFKKEKPAG
ncbi:MAG: hypothetical protein AAGB46_19630, partial [Verrucomicrobiota bacterium]